MGRCANAGCHSLRLARRRIIKSYFSARTKLRTRHRRANGRRRAARTQNQHPLARVGNVEVIQRRHKTFTIKQAAFDLAVCIAAHRVHGPSDAAQVVAAVQHVHDRRLVRNGDPHALDVFRHERRFDKGIQVLGRHVHRHQHGVDAHAGEDGVERLGRPYLLHRVTQNQVDIRGAGNRGGRQSRMRHICSLIDHICLNGADFSNLLVKLKAIVFAK